MKQERQKAYQQSEYSVSPGIILVLVIYLKFHGSVNN